MTLEELRWKLREYDDDTPVETFDPALVEFGEPRLRMIERDAINEEGRKYKQWVMRL